MTTNLDEIIMSCWFDVCKSDKLVKRIFALLNSYKSVGNYDIPNDIFLLILKDFVDGYGGLEYTYNAVDDDESPFDVILEKTNDKYYDLIVLQSKDESASVCMPLPLIKDIDTLQFLVHLQPTAIEKKFHDRKFHESTDEERLSRVTELKELFPEIYRKYYVETIGNIVYTC